MAKNKWYKSKGGWIGAIGGLLIPYFFLKSIIDGVIYHIPTFSNYLQAIFYGLIFKIDPLLGRSFSIIVYVMLIGGFLIGYFIQKMFFNKRRK